MTAAIVSHYRERCSKQAHLNWGWACLIDFHHESSDHHRFLLREALKHIDGLDEAIARVGQEIEQKMGSPETTFQEKAVVAEMIQK